MPLLPADQLLKTMRKARGRRRLAPTYKNNTKAKLNRDLWWLYLNCSLSLTLTLELTTHTHTHTLHSLQLLFQLHDGQTFGLTNDFIFISLQINKIKIGTRCQWPDHDHVAAVAVVAWPELAFRRPTSADPRNRKSLKEKPPKKGALCSFTLALPSGARRLYRLYSTVHWVCRALGKLINLPAKVALINAPYPDCTRGQISLAWPSKQKLLSTTGHPLKFVLRQSPGVLNYSFTF